MHGGDVCGEGERPFGVGSGPAELEGVAEELEPPLEVRGGERVSVVDVGVGVDVNPLLDNGLGVVTNVSVKKTGATQILASTQDHFSVPGNPFHEVTFVQMLSEAQGKPERMLGLGARPLFRSATANEFAKPATKST